VRIAQVSPLFESVPPKLYGGTERVVSFLTEALVDLGHDVTLFASGDSVTRAELVPTTREALRLDPRCKDDLAHHVGMLEAVFRRADEFDVIHFHLDYLALPLARRCGVPCVTTQHGRLDLPDLWPLFRTYSDAPMVSISDAQRTPVPFVNWRATVHHGLPPDIYKLHPRSKGYLAFLGRISREKRPDRAVEIACRLDMPIKFAAKISDADRPYYEQEIKPLFEDPRVEFLGEINEAEKEELLGNAAALLFPIEWPEPFGLVMIEALACGTPVVAFRRGSVSEVMKDGVSGYVVDDVDQAVDATRRALALPREGCRRYFEERFLARRMAEDYVKVYEGLVHERARGAGAPQIGRGRTATGLAAIEEEGPTSEVGDHANGYASREDGLRPSEHIAGGSEPVRGF
jgi:glycosyltransferase involved in cell wall biosynthesis